MAGWPSPATQCLRRRHAVGVRDGMLIFTRASAPVTGDGYLWCLDAGPGWFVGPAGRLRLRLGPQSDWLPSCSRAWASQTVGTRTTSISIGACYVRLRIPLAAA